ncbi:MAG: hypothetical protein PHH00_03790 [Candidatus Nanoarchaeia archaeon]|nr:hypothetical protein [Candidatus Nanoarchaeia archaeon]
MVNKELGEFIKEARRRGFSDMEIKEPLLAKGWNPGEVERALASLGGGLGYKNKVCFYMDSEVYAVIKKRAKKNLLTVEEQVEDIVRRSAVNAGGIKREEEKLDDLLVSVFSRKKTGKRKI